MAENKIELKSVSELLGLKFFIPSYQRGYRWTEQQVKDLLNDVKEFIQNKNSEFYSLQPLVVKKKWPDTALEQVKEKTSIEEIEDYINNCEWEVIDGQQRLTTIYIILYYLGDKGKTYSIEYATRKGFDDFLKKVEITEKNDFDDFLNECLDKNDFDNIDFYHVCTSYCTIKHWFEDENNGEVKLEDFKNQLLTNVKFIWYESVAEDPIEVFTRLNIGKIKLTNSELIKALMLNRSNFKNELYRHVQLRQQEIASEWDQIEYTFQNDEFWLFLHEKDYGKPTRPTRIDSIFDMICENDGLKVFMKQDKDKGFVKDPDKKNKKIGNDEYRTFRYFYEYFHVKENKGQYSENDAEYPIPEETLIEKCWNEVKKYYQTFQEWFNDLEMFHYIGFLVEQGFKLDILCELWTNDKTMFVYRLKKLIKDKIKGHADLEEIYEIEYKKDGKKIKGADKKNCRPVLLLHNVQTVIEQSKISHEKYQQSIFYKFPFHLYKKEGWDVEHIDSNTENDLTEKTSQNEFLINIYYAVDEETQKKIRDFINDPDATNFSDFKNYNNPKPLSGPEEKNQIWNYTLLDSSTNRSYGNAIFSAKRRIIIGKDRGVLFSIPTTKKEKGKDVFVLGDTKKATSAFIPPCTKQIFLKYYSPISTDFNYWTITDAKAYKQNILETLKEFGVTDNQNTKENGNN